MGLRKGSKNDSLKNAMDLKPTPLDFVNFIPWLCFEWQVPNRVVVSRMIQEEYVRPRCNSSKTKKVTRYKTNDSLVLEPDIKKSNSISTSIPKNSILSTAYEDEILNMIAYYDKQERLVEILIHKSPYKIHRKIIKAINLCVPFHSALTRLTISSSRNFVTKEVLYEIGKLLSNSNITDVCLDDSYLPNGAYDLLLDQKTRLKYLSLKRCGITDDGCIEIAKKIDYGAPASDNLMILDLTSNGITDSGALYLGDILRRNRRLLHLNLSGNFITDLGACCILNALHKFPLSADEILAMKCRKKKHLEKKAIAYEKYLEEMVLRRSKLEELLSSSKQIKTPRKYSKSFTRTDTLSTISLSTNASKRKQSKKSRHTQSTTSLSDPIMAVHLIGEFTDPFDAKNVILKANIIHSIGNFTLSSLNLSYNNIEMPTIRTVHETLKYQHQTIKPDNCTGLIRIMIEGNKLPNNESTLEAIHIYLKMAIEEKIPTVSFRKRSSSSTKPSVKISDLRK